MCAEGSREIRSLSTCSRLLRADFSLKYRSFVRFRTLDHIRRELFNNTRHRSDVIPFRRKVCV